ATALRSNSKRTTVEADRAQDKRRRASWATGRARRVLPYAEVRQRLLSRSQRRGARVIEIEPIDQEIAWTDWVIDTVRGSVMPDQCVD
ncbi:MAG TPA: hypothetical protein VGR45_15675, partial [Stellaceae bacterium]|nr:hypothetical protein [Stellaceae bacterium]